MSEKTVLNVEGMTCTNCALGVTRFLEKKGLTGVNVNFASGEVVFEEVTQTNIGEIIKGINNLGYHVVENQKVGQPVRKQPIFKTIEFKFWICVVFTLPLVAHMVLDIHLLHNPVFQLFCSLPVFIFGLTHFGKSAWSSLKTGVPNMDVLVTIGSVAAFGYSVAGMILYSNTEEVKNYLFFETSATIITLVLLGNIIEKRSVIKTTSALKELSLMQPVFANKITIQKNLSELVEQVEISSIKVNDAIIVNTGLTVPVDGKVYWGNATVDESALTGESIPSEKEIGSTVMAGSTVLNGSIKIRTEKVGSQTVLSNIIQLVKDAQQSKPEIQKLGDKISGWFVPAVVLISLLTFLLGYFLFDITLTKALMSAIAVLVISCPCAMGLATPTAVAVGLGKAAKNGILVKGGSTLEQFDDLKTAVFDKTGTLTTGNFKISEIKNYNDFSIDEAIKIIYSLEQHSSHPIAVSLVKELSKKTNEWISLENIKEEKGIGMSATDADGNRFLLGSFQAQRHLTTDDSHSVYLSKNDLLIATINIKDEIKAGAKEIISLLKAENIKPILLSGDNQVRCEEIGNELGIEEIYSNKLPHEKTEIIRSLKSKGKLLMVGDGINDAPSLELADLGLSFGDATKIAINSAQVILLNNNDLTAVMTAIRIGKMTMQTIRQNLFWAFFYNIVAIPIAAMGYLSPMVAAFSMAFSDVVVIGNSIRLKFRN